VLGLSGRPRPLGRGCRGAGGRGPAGPTGPEPAPVNHFLFFSKSHDPSDPVGSLHLKKNHASIRSTMEQGHPLPVGAVVAPATSAEQSQQLEQLNQLELPQWLSVPDPKPPALSPEAKALLQTQYEQMFERVIEQVYRGRSLRSLLEEDHRFISYEDFLRWIKRDPMRHERFKEAQESRTEFIAGEILEIADAEDTVEDVQRSKLKIDTRKWLMGAWNKKRYGEVKQVEVAGSISITEALQQAQMRIVEAEVVDVTPRLEN